MISVVPLPMNRLKQATAFGPVAAGLAVVANDTGRVLMIQRPLSDDLNSGKWEFPGGRIEEGEQPHETAVREWEEETGLKLPEYHYRNDGGVNEWNSNDGKYRGFVLFVLSESVFNLNARDLFSDPDSEVGGVVAWVHPRDLPQHNLRPALLSDVDEVMAIVTKWLLTRQVRKAKPKKPEEPSWQRNARIDAWKKQQYAWVIYTNGPAEPIGYIQQLNEAFYIISAVTQSPQNARKYTFEAAWEVLQGMKRHNRQGHLEYVGPPHPDEKSLRKSAPVNRLKASFFETCDRDDERRCKPESGSEASGKPEGSKQEIDELRRDYMKLDAKLRGAEKRGVAEEELSKLRKDRSEALRAYEEAKRGRRGDKKPEKPAGGMAVTELPELGREAKPEFEPESSTTTQDSSGKGAESELPAAEVLADRSEAKRHEDAIDQEIKEAREVGEPSSSKRMSALWRISGALAGARRGEDVVALKVDGKVVAAANLQDKKGGRLHIHEMGSVQPGAGSQVMRQILEHARKRGFKKITADASPDMVKLGLKFGFKVTGPDNDDGTPITLNLGASAKQAAPAPLRKDLGGTVQAAGRWLADKWASLEERYGRKTALAMAVAMLSTLPVPGNIAAVIAVAEGIRGISGYFQRECGGSVVRLKSCCTYPINRLQKSVVTKTSPDQVLQAMDQLGHGRDKFTKLSDLGRRLGGSPESLHAAVMQLWRQGTITVAGAEGRHGSTEEERRWWMHAQGEVLGYVMLKN